MQTHFINQPIYTLKVMQKKSLFISLLLINCAVTFAQVRGTLESVSKQLPFNHSFQNIALDPAPKIGNASRVQFTQTFNPTKTTNLTPSQIASVLSAGNVSVPGWVDDLAGGVASFFCSSFDPYFDIGGSVDAGAYYEIKSIGNSNVDVNYPVQVVVDYPAANTFACGETIRIKTAYTVLDPTGKKLQVKAPFVNQEIGPILNNLSFNASIGIRASFGIGVDIPFVGEICEDVGSFDEGISFSQSVSLPTLPPLLNFCESAFGPGANSNTLLDCNDNGVNTVFKLGQNALDIYNDLYNHHYTFATFPDEHTVVIAPPDLPDGGPTIPEMEATFKDVSNTDLTYTSLDGGKKLKVAGTKSAMSEMSIDLVSLIDYTEVVQTSYSLGDGVGSIDIGDVSPTMTVNQTLDFEYNPIVNLQVNIGASLPYTVYKTDNTVDHTGTGQIVQLIAGQYIDVVLPQGQTSPLNGSGNSNLNGTFKSLSSQKYFRKLHLAFGQVAVGGVFDFTLYETDVLESQFDEKNILDYSFNMALPGTITLPNFILDPENPIVDVSYLKSEDIVNLGGGRRKVVYKVGITNPGDVALKNVQSAINLASAFAGAQNLAVTCINSSDFTVNSAFNGNSDKNLLAANNTLAVGETKYLEFIIELTPAKSAVLPNGCFGVVNYTIKAKATATSPIGSNIQSDYNQCTMQVLAPDILTAIDLGAEKVSGLNSFTVYGWKEVRFDKPFTTSYGNVGSYADMVFENVSQKNGTGVTIVGDLHVREKLRLNGKSDVLADYIQNTGVPILNGQCTLNTTGVVSANSMCVTSIPKPLLVKPVNNSTVAVTVAAGATRILAPGSYSTVNLGANAILVMKPGVYNIDTWKFSGANTKVKYQSANQPITVHVDKFQPGSAMNMAIDGAGKVSDVTVYAYGNSPAKFDNSFVQGNLIAPNTEVEFDTNSKLEGSCYADKVNFKNGSVFKGTKFTLPVNVSPACQSSAAPITIAKMAQGSRTFDSMQSAIVVYPNPVHDKLIITGLDANVASTLRLIDMQGRQLKEFTTHSDGFEIDMQYLNTGVYILIVDDHKQSFKIIKE
jgi:hypothetical protein